MLNVLHLEPDQSDADIVQAKLAESGLSCHITRVQTRHEFETALRNIEYDIILAEYRLPDWDGLSALRLAGEAHPEVPFIFVSGAIGEEAVIEALTQGATDYVLKPKVQRIESAIQRALGKTQSRRDRKRTERALADSEAKLRSILENVGIGVSLISPRMEILDINRLMRQWFPEIDLSKRPICYEAYYDPPRQEACDYCPARKTFEDGQVHEVISQNPRNGVIYNYRVISTPLLNEAGEVIAAIELVEDITQRLLAEKATQHSNDMLRAIIEATPVAVIGLDLDGHVRSVWNPAAEKMLGWSAEEVMGRPLPTVPAESQEEFRGFRERIRKGMTLDNVEVIRQRRDGTPIEYSISASPLHDAQGNISGNIAVLTDITERKQAERERLANLKFFESMDKINRAMQGTNDLEQMMKDVLDVVLATLDCDRAYLLYPCDPEAPSWTVPMESYRPEYPGVLEWGSEMPMDADVATSLRILLDSDGPVKFGPGTKNPVPEEVSQRFRFKCFMAMALYPKVGKPWQFGIHQCSHPRIWTEEDEKLFNEIGRRLGDTLSNLLTYRDLRESEAFLDNIVEHIPNIIFVKDAENLRFVKFNKAGENLLGLSRNEVVGKTDYEVFPKEIADFHVAKDREVLASGKLLDLPEDTVRDRNGEMRTVHVQKLPILDENGVPQYLLGIAEDVTERRQTEESVRKLSQAIEQSPVSIVVTDPKGNIEFVNTKFTQITGYSFEEALGKNPRILKSGETANEEYRKLWRTITSGGVWQGEFHNRKKDGELFWERATIAPLRNEDDVITHFVAVKEDISEQKKLEEQLRQAQKMEAVGQLAGGVAHDFNNMLGVIIGHTELALDQVDPGQPLYDDLREIWKAAGRSADLTRQLLAFARKQTVAPKVLDLNETIEGMLKILRRLIGEDIDLAWLPGARVWPVNVDPSQIDQILANLCVNARDAIPGVGKVTIETDNKVFDEDYCTAHTGYTPGEYVMLAVSDDGVGMDQETLDKIFEPFFTTKGIGKGTGLGLATVYGIVKQNDGFVNVYSEPGRGATFKVYLPRHAAAAGQAAEAGSPTPAVQGSETILVVEDDVSMLEMVKLMLEGYGYRVLIAPTPSEALQTAESHAGGIDLLLSDLIMPEMNGWELSQKVSALHPQIKCVFMSGYTGNAVVHQGVLDEGVNFLQKPFAKHALAVKLREVLDEK